MKIYTQYIFVSAHICLLNFCLIYKAIDGWCLKAISLLSLIGCDLCGMLRLPFPGCHDGDALIERQLCVLRGCIVDRDW